MNQEEQDTRERLVQAAIRLFAEQGYKQTTVRQICLSAEANLNAIKYYFTDKEGLYVEAVKRAHRARMEQGGIAQADRIAEQFAGDPELRLRAFVEGMVSMAMSAQDRSDVNHQLMFREIANPTVATEHIVRDFIGPLFDRLNRILAELLPETIAPLTRQMLAFSVVGQCMHYKMAAPIIPMLLPAADRRRLKPDQVAEHVVQVTLAAVRYYREQEAGDG